MQRLLHHCNDRKQKMLNSQCELKGQLPFTLHVLVLALVLVVNDEYNNKSMSLLICLLEQLCSCCTFFHLPFFNEMGS